MHNLTKKQKFIILTVLGSLVILATFIWSMFINLSQVKISNPVPEIKLPETQDETNTKENTVTDQSTQEDKDKNKEDNSDDNKETKDELDLEKILN